MIAVNRLKDLFRERVLSNVNRVSVPDGSTRLRLIDSDTLWRKDFTQKWLVKNVLIADRPGILGGPSKSLKTSLVADLCVSLASGSSFLGHFQVPHAIRVGIFSAESGGPALKRLLGRVCAAKQIADPGRLPIFWSFEAPVLSDADDVSRLADLIREHELRLIVVDPLYMALAGLNADLQAMNMFQVGPVLRNFTRACEAAGATPLIVHHYRQSQGEGRGDWSGVPDLSRLAYAGAQQFFRQWLLVDRRSQFDPDIGRSELTLAVGGSDGHAGHYVVTVDEGVMDADFNGRKWDVRVAPLHQFIQKKQEEKNLKKQDAANKDVEAVVNHLLNCRDGDTKSGIELATKLSRKRVNAAVEYLRGRGEIVETKVRKPGGNAKKHQYDGFKLSPNYGCDFDLSDVVDSGSEPT